MTTNSPYRQLLLKIAKRDPNLPRGQDLEDTIDFLKAQQVRLKPTPGFPSSEGQLLDYLESEKKRLREEALRRKIKIKELTRLEKGKRYLTSGWRPLAVGGTAALGTAEALRRAYLNAQEDTDFISPDLGLALQQQQLQAGLPPQM